jgi:hypothetical protein
MHHPIALRDGTGTPSQSATREPADPRAITNSSSAWLFLRWNLAKMLASALTRHQAAV